MSDYDREEIRHLLRKLMWERVGIIRCGESLNAAKRRIGAWASLQAEAFTRRRDLELKNMLEVSALITESALLRKGSVGAHYRSDCRQKGEGWERHITCRKDREGTLFEFIQ
jgi:L-aspartate oxidase